MSTKGSSRIKFEKDSRKFIESVYRAFGGDTRKVRTFNDLVLKYHHGNVKLLEFQKKLIEMLKDHADIIDQFNRLVPEEYRVPVEDTEKNLQEAVRKGIAKLEKNRPKDLEALIKILQAAKDKTREIGEDSYAKLDSIFKDEPELRDAIKLYMQSEQPKVKEEELQPEPSNTKEANYQNNLDDYKTPAAYRYRATRRRGISDVRELPNRKVDDKTLPDTNEQVVVTTVSVSAAIKSEQLLFQVLQENLSQSQYEELAKCIALFIEMIISTNELFDLTKGLFKDEKYFAFFQEIITTREASRRKQISLFKPSTEFDFSTSVRTASYTKATEYYPLVKVLKSKNPIINEEINHVWLSVPHGSEQSYFTLIRKNTFEEALFKCEEERYEYDHKIQILQFGILWLEEIMNPDTPQEKIDYLIERVIKLKIVQKLYDDNTEVVELLRKNTKTAGKVILERLKTRLSEVNNLKLNVQKPVWAEIAEKNFHRSLDHRSFSIKHYEKKLTNPKYFVEDAARRYRNLQTPITDTDVSKYWQLLNTFEGISNDTACQQPLLKTDEFEKAQKIQVSLRKKCPIYRMGFYNEQIRKDIAEILWLSVLNFHSNNNEKEKIKRTFKTLLVEIIGFDYSREPDLYEHVIPEEKLLSVVSRIESTIYDKSFSFYRHTEPQNEAVKEISKETIYNVIDEIMNQKSNSSDHDGGAPDEKPKNAKEGKLKPPAAEKRDDASVKSNQKGDSVSESRGSDSEEEAAKAMEYLQATNNTVFLPIKRVTSKLLYGTKHFLSVYRLFFTLYERFLRAWEIAHTFESNHKTEQLSKEEKTSLSNERYETFKWILVHLIRADIESIKYEDLLRSLFGKDAYALVYVDKIVNSTIKSLQNLANDDLSSKFIHLYFHSIGIKSEKSHPRDKNKMEIELPSGITWQEELYVSKMNQLAFNNLKNLSDANFFRFLWDEGILNVNLYEVPYKGWNDEGLESTAEYLEKYVTHVPLPQFQGNSKIFLARNKAKVKKDMNNNPNQKTLQIYRIEYKTLTNSFKLIPDSYGQEDIIFRLNRNSKAKTEGDTFDKEYKRAQKFKKIFQL